jgi:hypothetical protein
VLYVGKPVSAKLGGTDDVSGGDWEEAVKTAKAK